jgi:uncharacterized protein YmfQ (DUF2313 family)
VTQADVKRLLISLFPDGSADLYALDNTDLIGGWINSLAGALKDCGADRLEALIRELNPATISENIAAWEAATGLSQTPIALYGSTEQRKNAVLTVLRMRGSFSLDDMRAILQPYFLYADPTQIEILEPNRTAQRTAHTYAGVALGPAPAVFGSVSVADDPRVSPAGATLYFTISTTRLDGLTVTISGPGGNIGQRVPGFFDTEQTIVVNQAYKVSFPEFAGKAIRGTWRVEFFNSALVNVTISAWALFVEGLGMNYTGTPPAPNGQGLGAALFQFVAVADPAKLGTGYDLDGAARALTRWKPAHTQGGITILSAALGAVCAIPDTINAIPDNAIPC